MNTPKELLQKAINRVRVAADKFNPIAIVALFSGGHDSGTASLIAHEAGASITLHINTGIGVEQTRDYVRETCSYRNWNLKEYKATENQKADGTPDPKIYEDMVRRWGFPGPFMHSLMYQWLKERQLARFERDIGATSKRPVIYIGGQRSSESVRRMKNILRADKNGIMKEGRRLWCSAIFDFSKSDCGACMEYCGLKRNQVVDLIHKSGECLCGAYAKPGELSELEMWFPDTAKRIRDLEREVMSKFPWGWESHPPRKDKQDPRQQLLFDADYQPLCHHCNLNHVQQNFR